MQPRFLSFLKSEAAGNLVWRLLEHPEYADKYPCPIALVYVDRDGKEWPIPADFLCDYYSGIRPIWWHTPPSTGQKDRAAALHDFMVRWRKRLGLSLMDCHRHFRDAMLAVGARTARANTRYVTVVALNWMCAGAGYGRHSDEIYNTTFEIVQDRVFLLYPQTQ